MRDVTRSANFIPCVIVVVELTAGVAFASKKFATRHVVVPGVVSISKGLAVVASAGEKLAVCCSRCGCVVVVVALGVFIWCFLVSIEWRVVLP